MKNVRLWIPMLLFGNVIFLASQFGSVPKESPLLAVYGAIDTIGHAALYFGLGFFVARYLSLGMQVRPAGVLVIGSALCLLFGFFDEMHQIYIPGRSPEVRDLMTDLLGGLSGAVVYAVLAGAAGWAKEMLCSAQVGLRTVLVRAAVGVCLLVAVCSIAVVHAATISGFLFSAAVEGSWFVTQTVESMQRAYAARAADGTYLRASLAVRTPAAVGPDGYGAGADPKVTEPKSKGARTHEAVPAAVERPPADPKKYAVPESVQGIVRDIEREIMTEIVKASQGLDKSIATSKPIAVREKDESRPLSRSPDVNAASHSSLVRDRIISAIAARAPQIKQIAGGIVHKETSEANRMVLGVSEKRPEKCDLVAIIANSDNPVTEISLDQARKIFSGEFNNWSQVGGPDLPITVVTVRKRSPEVEESLKAHLKAPISPKATRLPLVGLIIPAVAMNKGAVGFIPIQNTEQLDFVAQHKAFKRVAIRAGQDSPAVAPDRTALISGEYPIMNGEQSARIAMGRH